MPDMLKIACGPCCAALAVLACVLAAGCLGKAGGRSLVVGRDIGPAAFREFFCTRAATTNPPMFQRHHIRMDNGRPVFRHEKREGSTVFLTEKDVTVSGTRELSPEEWERFWGLIAGGTVTDRKEDPDAGTGGSGPWLFLYWDGDRGRTQVYEFAQPDRLPAFEEFCAEIRRADLEARGDRPERCRPTGPDPGFFPNPPCRP